MEVTKEQAMAYTEVIEILKYMPEEDVNKIPQDILDYYKNNMDKDYVFYVEEGKSFEEQKISEKAKVVLAILFRDYWATDKQKEKIQKKEEYDLNKIEEEKREKYNPDDVFKNKEKNEEVIEEKNTEENKEEKREEEVTALVEYKEENWFIKFINFMKRIFGRK